MLVESNWVPLLDSLSDLVLEADAIDRLRATESAFESDGEARTLVIALRDGCSLRIEFEEYEGYHTGPSVGRARLSSSSERLRRLDPTKGLTRLDDHPPHR
ncbi:MAG: hypothetical protein R3F34_19240 [Planctomycetota bacterium]